MLPKGYPNLQHIPITHLHQKTKNSTQKLPKTSKTYSKNANLRVKKLKFKRSLQENYADMKFRTN